MGLFNRTKKSGQPEKSGKASQAPKKRDLTLAELNGEKPVAKDSATPAVKAVSKDKRETKNAYRVLIKPLITEKGTYLASEGKYLFSINPEFTKTHIKQAIKAVYGVTAIKINIINRYGKKVRYGKSRGVTKDVKKAIVTLKKGESIAVYEGV